MSTTIEWTQRPGTKGETWNPVVGCTKVSAGCKFCYAKTIHDNRHKAYKEGKLQNTPQYAKPFEHVQLMHERLAMPLHWKEPRTVFVNSVSDLFHEDVPFDYIDQVFAVMGLTPRHTYQILTKRPDRMAEYLNGDFFVGRLGGAFGTVAHLDGQSHACELAWSNRGSGLWGTPPFPNVWLGTSVEDQATADERIPHLLRCPAAVRFLSCEPLLGPIEFSNVTNRSDAATQLGKKALHGIDWVIGGGESGPGARPMHPDWARSLRDQCKAADVPFFFKQWGTWAPMDMPAEQEDIAPLALNERWMNVVGGHGFHGERVYRMRKGTKHTGGNLLDGVEHSNYPTQSTTHQGDLTADQLTTDR